MANWAALRVGGAVAGVPTAAALPKLMAPAETQSPDTAQVETKVLIGAVANSTSVNLDLVA